MKFTLVFIVYFVPSISIATIAVIPSFRHKRDDNIVKCRNALPDYGVFEYGFDVTEIDLFACPRVAGNRAKIFDLNNCGSNRQKWSNSYSNVLYDIPDSFGLITTSASNEGARLFNDLDQYRQSLMTSINAGDEFKNSTFVKSRGYEIFPRLFLHNYQVVVSMKFENFYALSMDENMAQMSLKSEFQKMVNSLPMEFKGNEATYIDFIKQYGTHYLSHAVFGGLTRRVTVFGPNYQENSTKLLINKANTKFPNLVEGDVEMCSDSTRNNVAQYRNYELNYTQLFIGGQISDILNKGVHHWIRRVHLNPGLIQLTLQPISSLLTTRRGEELHTAIVSYAQRAHLDAEMRTFKMIIQESQYTNHHIESILADYQSVLDKKVYDLIVIKELVNRINSQRNESSSLNEISAAIKTTRNAAAKKLILSTGSVINLIVLSLVLCCLC